MDAPPETGDIAQFVRIAALLRDMGLSAPEIYAEDHANGFLLLEDFGDSLFAAEIAREPGREPGLYAEAAEVLAVLDAAHAPGDLPRYGPDVMADLMAPAWEWYRWAVTGNVGDWGEVRSRVAEAFSGVSTDVLALRDFHAENLIHLPRRCGAARVGLLDFQDAMVGPPAYDLASLLLDARRDVSPPVIEETMRLYADRTGRPLAEAEHLFALNGLQRNIRILGVFTRLALKHDKARYLQMMPRVWDHVQRCLASGAVPGLSLDLPEPTTERLRELSKRCGTCPSR